MCTAIQSDFVDIIKEMMTNTNSCEACEEKGVADVKDSFKICQENCFVQLQQTVMSVVGEVGKQATMIIGMIFDRDALMKPDSLDDRLEKMRNREGKSSSTKSLKTFQGADGRGIKYVEIFVIVMTAAGCALPSKTTLGPTQAVYGELGDAASPITYNDFLNKFIEVRQLARLQLSMRSAAIIISSKDTAALATWDTDIKPIKRMFPKGLR